jgi:hemerythrin-like domain-containing protein
LLRQTDMSAELPTSELRKEHGTVRSMINDLEGRIAGSAGRASDLERAIDEVMSFIMEELEPHAAWEQRVLYPLIDRWARSDIHPFTATMRHEHAIMGRWVRKLEAARARAVGQPVHWVIQAGELLGLLRAHLEVEEEVLFPILDDKARADELRPPKSLSTLRPTTADAELP